MDKRLEKSISGPPGKKFSDAHAHKHVKLHHFCKKLCFTPYGRDREPMAREPDVALLMTASGSLDIFLTRLLRMQLFCNFPTKPSVTLCNITSRINSKKHVTKEKIQTFTIV